MGDTEQDAINALRAAGLEREAQAVEQLRRRHKETMDAYHAGQRASYAAGQAAEREQRQQAREELVQAWNNLPDALRCHPGLKRLYAAAQRA